MALKKGHKTSLKRYMCRLHATGEKRGREEGGLMWPQFNSHKWIEFVGSLLCFESAIKHQSDFDFYNDVVSPIGQFCVLTVGLELVYNRGSPAREQICVWKDLISISLSPVLVPVQPDHSEIITTQRTEEWVSKQRLFKNEKHRFKIRSRY